MAKEAQVYPRWTPIAAAMLIFKEREKLGKTPSKSLSAMHVFQAFYKQLRNRGQASIIQIFDIFPQNFQYHTIIDLPQA